MDFCGDVTHHFKKLLTAACGFSQAATPMLFRNPATYIRKVLVNEPSRNPEPFANTAQRWERCFIESRLCRSSQFGSAFFNAHAVASQYLIAKIGLVHSQGGRCRTAQLATQFGQRWCWMLFESLLECLAYGFKAALSYLRDLPADSGTKPGELLLYVPIV